MIRIVYIVLFLFLLFPRLPGQSCYTLVWADEFNTDGAPNSSNWTLETGASGWGNNEIQNYTNSTNNARVENGNLVIEARNDNGQWTSARLISAGKKTFTYGRIEFRAKLPLGSGTWPALWMLGSDIGTNPWPACGEIDIMEHVGKDPGKVHASLHSSSSYGATVNTAITTVQNVADYHIYRMDWTAVSMKFYVDETLYYTYAPSPKTAQNWPFGKPFFLIMNVAMGGNWGSDPKYETNGLKNGIDPALTSVKMEVDYVRVYQISSQPAMEGPTIMDASQTAIFSVPVNDALNYNWSVPADAEILSGQNSPQINVKWGNTSGNILLSVSTPCKTFNLPPYSVRARIKPDTSEFHFPVNNLNNQINWEVVPSPGNSITLSNTPDLGIFYQISQPTSNPKIRYLLPNIYNFSDYKYLVVKLKNEINNPPSIVRIDLVDMNNNVNLDQIFRITSFSKTDTFKTYASGIASSSSFDLTNTTELHLYINYGIFGKADTGNIHINDIYIARHFDLATPQIENKSFHIYPNPAKTSFFVQGIINPNLKIQIFDHLGVFISEQELRQCVPVDHLKKGVYFIKITGNDRKQEVFKLLKE